MTGRPTVLVSMPFMDVDRPSIQLGLLKAMGEQHGFPVRTLHANLGFAARIGVDFYRELAETRQPMLGDWLFSLAAFGDAAPDRDGKLLADDGELRERLLRVRSEDVPAYLESLVAGFPWQEAGVVGFSCTFQQNTASFALARMLKQRHPGIVTLFGGANFDGDMGPELVRAIDCIDFAVVGEADTAFPLLLRALASGADPGTVPGVVRRTASGEVTLTPPAPPLEQLDDLPVPDYGEYFAKTSAASVWIPFESARGCWWGAKHHCTFCGLNGTTMRYRSKSPRRVREELAQQARRHGSFRFEAVDNILDMRYLKELFPVLADAGTGYEFFYEAKANLSRAQLKTLARGGVTRLQPGLESLSTNVLRLMDKGVRAAQNVNLLRWARYYGIDVAWSILWGFPGETAQDYAGQAAVMPDLVHLQPPGGAGRIWLERFSPLFRSLSKTPERSYRYVYPSGVDLDRVAYFFEYEMDGALPDSAYDGLRCAVAEWRGAWESGPVPVLRYRSAPGVLQIYDGRHQGREGTYTFRGTLAGIYLACADRPATAAGVSGRLGVPTGAVEEAFDGFQRRGLMFLDGSLALALALPAVPGR